MPMNQWLPNRYRSSYFWPVEQARVQKQADGITFFNAQKNKDTALPGHARRRSQQGQGTAWRSEVVTVVRDCCEITILLIDLEQGERKAPACANA